MEQVFGYARRILKEVGSEKVDYSNEGCLVSVQGLTATDELLCDADFNFRFTNCAKIKRAVEMYQWVESSTTEERDTPGGGKDKVTTYSYDMRWVGTHNDSSTFHDSYYQNQNPPFPIGDRELVAMRVSLGAFSLTKKLISQMVDWRAANELPPSCFAAGRSFRQQGSSGVYMTNLEGQPQLGDMRVTFQQVECGNATVLALQHDNSFTELSYAMIPKRCSWPWSPPPAKVDLSQPLLEHGKDSLPTNPCCCIGNCIQSGEELNELAEAHLSAGEMMGRAEGKQKCIHLGLLTLGYFMFFIGFLLQFQFVPTLFRIVPWIGTWVQYFGNAVAFVGAFFCGCFWWSGTLAFSWLFSRPIRAILLFSFATAMVAVPTVLSQGH
ncbi:unnamed protein product [Prorocentrum cordatum]|uniref:Transmembrane 9 superfamily member n=1 Tax=Prorocentrum cordatum TaxID=2364126 RepID=A0ABN9RQA5_9DINO|nr:unnamed protein product [Polarella glacialis]